MLTNLPAGKAFIMPREGTMNGTIIIDGSWDSTHLEEKLELAVGVMSLQLSNPLNVA